jgi:hypothetical protein
MINLCEAILVDFSASYWLRDALRSALERDPTDALQEAELLLKALRENLEQRLFEAKLMTAQNNIKRWTDGWDFYKNNGAKQEYLPQVADCEEWIKGYVAAMTDYDVESYPKHHSILTALLHHGIAGDLLEACLCAAESVCTVGEQCSLPSLPVHVIESQTLQRY